MVTLGLSAIGFDLSVESNEDDWACLKEADASFAMVRVYRNLGQVDRNSTNSILAAASVIDNIDGYMFPCIQNSPYAQSQNLTCDDAATQVTKTLTYLAQAGIGVTGSSVQPTPYFPLRATLGRIWIDVEDEVRMSVSDLPRSLP